MSSPTTQDVEDYYGGLGQTEAEAIAESEAEMAAERAYEVYMDL